jgi:hypothetical protein
MKTEKYLTDGGLITTDITQAKFLKIMFFDDETGDSIKSWTIEIDPANIKKSLLHLDLSHHDIQVLSYFRNGDIVIEYNKLQSSGMVDSLKNLERLNLVDSRSDQYKTTYKLNNNGKKILQEL